MKKKKSDALRAFWFITVNFLRIIGYHLSNIVPKNNNIWIYGARRGRDFFDNSKYFFIYMNKHHPEVKSIWLSKDKNIIKKLRKQKYEAYQTYSLKGIYLSLKAGFVILNNGVYDVNFYLIGKNTKKIQLFHGMPLKKIGYDDKITLEEDKSYRKKLELFIKFRNKYFPFIDNFDPTLPYVDNYDYLVATSKENLKRFSSAFKINEKNIILTGSPRNDALFDDLFKEKCVFIKNLSEKIQFNYVISYLPTYRDKGNIKYIFSKFQYNPEELNNILEKLNAIMIIKLHPRDIALNIQLFEESFERIIVITDKEISDIYPLLKKTDVLITDYSSVYFDYLLLNRPIIFAPFDIDEYLTRDRELYYSYDKVTPGPKAKNWPDIIYYVSKSLKNNELKKEEREKISKIFNLFFDGRSSERLYKILTSKK